MKWRLNTLRICGTIAQNQVHGTRGTMNELEMLED